MFRIRKNHNKLKILQQHIQLQNDIPIWDSIKNVILRKFLVIFKVGHIL